MRQEIIDWYAERHYEPTKLFKKGSRNGFSQAKIEASMVHCYEKIMSGKKIPDIDLARYVFNVARDVDFSQAQNEFITLNQAKEEVKELQKRLRKYQFAFYGAIALIVLEVLRCAIF